MYYLPLTCQITNFTVTTSSQIRNLLVGSKIAILLVGYCVKFDMGITSKLNNV